MVLSECRISGVLILLDCDCYNIVYNILSCSFLVFRCEVLFVDLQQWISKDVFVSPNKDTHVYPDEVSFYSMVLLIIKHASAMGQS